MTVPTERRLGAEGAGGRSKFLLTAGRVRWFGPDFWGLAWRRSGPARRGSPRCTTSSAAGPMSRIGRWCGSASKETCRANDIAVLGADQATGVIMAKHREYQDAGWADCERARVIDRTSNSRRPRRARPLSRDLALEVTLRESAGDTEVQPLARFTEQQNDPHRNSPFTQPCRSTGVLERALLDAIGDTAASPAASEPADVSRSL